MAQLLFRTRTLAAIKLWGAALHELHTDHGVAWTAVTYQMLDEVGATMEDIEGLVDFLLSSPEVKVAIVLKEEVPGETKVSMRTVPGVDATAIVGSFGGGGHQRAAGCTIPAAAPQAASLLLPLVDKELAPPARA
jgi:phosphoesterase RecJ-like protein